MIATLESRKARILTVDDDSLVLAMLAIKIRKAGYDIVQASSAEEALDVIAENQPDLAVLDISMPGMSGIELAQRLRAETDIPFMFLSTHTEADIVRQATGQGAIGYLVKPVDFTHVISVIEAGLAHTRTLHDLPNEHERASRCQPEADLSGRYAELVEIEILLQQAQARTSRPYETEPGCRVDDNRPTSRTHAEIKALEGHIKSVCNILDAYRGCSASPALDMQARDDLDKITGKLVLGLLRRETPALLGEYRTANRRVWCIVRALKDASLTDGSNSRQGDLHAILDAALESALSQTISTAAVGKEYTALTSLQHMPAELGRVFMNLFVNAAQAVAENEHALINVRTGMTAQQVWVEVSDNGCGIAQENRELIFHPFYTTRPAGAGVGLGLSMSRDIVRKHGGDIAVTSMPGAGSVFRVSLPLSPT